MLRQSMLVFVVALIVFMWVNPASAQIIKDRRRAISVGTCVDEADLPADVKKVLTDSKIEEYQNESSRDGMSMNPAHKFGWEKMVLWNERPANARHPRQFCATLVDPNANVWTMNGDSQPLFGYLDGCNKAGVPGFKNILLVPPPPEAPAQPAQQPELCDNGMTLDAADAAGYTVTRVRGRYVCVKPTPPVTPTATPAPTPASCVGCELFEITQAEWRSQGVKAYLPSWQEAGASAAGSVIGAIFGHGSIVKSVIAGEAETVVYNVIFPDKNLLILTINGQRVEVHRNGKPSEVTAEGNTFTLTWKGDNIEGRLNGRSICYNANVRNAFTTGSMVIGAHNGSPAKVIPVKQENTPEHPRPGTDGTMVTVGGITVPNGGVVQSRPKALGFDGNAITTDSNGNTIRRTGAATGNSTSSQTQSQTSRKTREVIM